MQMLTLSVWITCNERGNFVARVRQPMAMGFCYGSNLFSGVEIGSHDPERAIELVIQKLQGMTRKVEIQFEPKIDAASRVYNYKRPWGRKIADAHLRH